MLLAPLVAAALALGLVAATPGAASAAYPNLRTGSTGPDVTAVQHLLTHHGQSTPADGQFGDGTQAAVSAFQQGSGLVVDGVAGPQTIAALVVPLAEGDSGHAVQALQVLLEARGHAVLGDGDFGPQTAQAVRDFQAAGGLAVDGQVGPQTWTALFGTGSSSPPGSTYDSLSDEQKANARTIIGVGKGAGVGEQGWVVALATAMQESTLVNVDYGDRDSLGLFQQRPSQGWGTEAQVQDPVLSSQAFYGTAAHTPNPGLLDIAGWESMSVTQAAQAVQRSAYPDAYARWEGLARDIVAHESGTAPIG
ncbi:peptidoglycan-binding protein [Nocardioides zeae]|uniref:Peptidoglycan-binding protein n=1 Tax=Nocardioides imazamoxiresistens TaxID=3231893 RepID=A0ABU3PX97_9ACTN|nr:peptidoglycan-binding protein [Nocardioides zeae]MDT9593774.1 peptidoglycan-binding protein [Nocardioides zeae]